jgi:hypothetical protein
MERKNIQMILENYIGKDMGIEAREDRKVENETREGRKEIQTEKKKEITERKKRKEKSEEYIKGKEAKGR